MKHHAERSFANKATMDLVDTCGCYYCCKIYNPREIVEWVNDHSGQTPICPHCGIDSVVPYNQDMDGNLVGFADLLKQWHEESFT